MSVPALRPRTATELIDAAFRLMRQIYPQLVAASAVFFLPVLALRLVLPESLAGIATLLSNLLQSAASAAVILVVSDCYLGRPVQVGSAVRRVSLRFSSVFWASFLQGLLVFLGFLLLIVPGVIAAALTFAMPMVVMVEGRRATESVGRSRELARGSVGRILGTLGLAFLVYLLFLAMAGAVLGLMSGGNTSTLADFTLQTVLTILLYPFVGVVGTLLYYDLRIRREGFDLEIMAAELDGGVSVAPAVAQAGG